MITLKKLFVLALFFLVFLGIPYLIGSWWHLTWSWIFAIIAMYYLDESVVKK